MRFQRKMKTFNLLDFDAVPGDGNQTPVFRKALNACAKEGVKTLIIPKGVWHLYREGALEKHRAISNNSMGDKLTPIPLENLKDFTLSGDGATLVAHGIMLPIYAGGCNNLSLKGFTLDWEDPFLSQVKILEVTEAGVLFTPTSGAPLEYRDGTLYLTGEGWSFPISNFLEFTPDGKTAPKAEDNAGSGWNKHRVIHSRGNNEWFMDATMSTPPVPGNYLILKGGKRHSPGIFLEECVNTRFEGLTVHHAGGMALIAQRCEHITVENIRVTPSKGRIFSSSADATHFSLCRGKVVIKNCLMEGQMDDPGNIHGVYGLVKKQIASQTLEVALGHVEQFGITLFKEGEKVRFIDPETMLPLGDSTATKVQIVSHERMLVTFDPAPPALPDKAAIENLDFRPSVLIEGNVTRKNRARGFLVTTAGEVVIRKNHFQNPGSAVKIEGDSQFWFESGSCDNLLIEDNVFDDCNYGVWGRGAIAIDPKVARLGHGFFHRNIRIKNNTFRVREKEIVFARNVSGLEFSGNTITSLGEYKAGPTDFFITVEDCENVQVDPRGPRLHQLA